MSNSELYACVTFFSRTRSNSRRPWHFNRKSHQAEYSPIRLIIFYSWCHPTTYCSNIGRDHQRFFLFFNKFQPFVQLKRTFFSVKIFPLRQSKFELISMKDDHDLISEVHCHQHSLRWGPSYPCALIADAPLSLISSTARVDRGKEILPRFPSKYKAHTHSWGLRVYRPPAKTENSKVRSCFRLSSLIRSYIDNITTRRVDGQLWAQKKN